MMDNKEEILSHNWFPAQGNGYEFLSSAVKLDIRRIKHKKPTVLTFSCINSFQWILEQTGAFKLTENNCLCISG
jgi:hypothetical protein